MVQDFFTSIPSRWFDYVSIGGVMFCLGFAAAGSGTNCWGFWF